MRLKSSSVCAINASRRRLSFVSSGFPKLRSCHSRADSSCIRLRAALVLLSIEGGPEVGGRCANVGAATDRRMAIPIREHLPAVCCLFIADLPDFLVSQYSPGSNRIERFV